MATTEHSATVQGNLQELAKRHLWMHFTRLGAYADHDVPIIVRGEGCHVYDEHGNRYFDGLSALFCVNIGHGRADVAQAGADQARELVVLARELERRLHRLAAAAREEHAVEIAGCQ